MSDSSQISQFRRNVPFSTGKLYIFQECNAGESGMWECRENQQHNQSNTGAVYRHRAFLSPVRA